MSHEDEAPRELPVGRSPSWAPDPTTHRFEESLRPDRCRICRASQAAHTRSL